MLCFLLKQFSISVFLFEYINLLLPTSYLLPTNH